MNRAASSTVTGPVPAAETAARPLLGAVGSGRSSTNVSVSAETPARCSPARYWARSTMCAPRSPSEPEPACSRRSRQVSGNCGSTSQSWRYATRTCRRVPMRPSSTIRRASAVAGTRR
ncbi:hypothetical protein SALBM217S_09636 [Streptomyces griseoloalbus]